MAVRLNNCMPAKGCLQLGWRGFQGFHEIAAQTKNVGIAVG
jgi:hypothetical protein